MNRIAASLCATLAASLPCLPAQAQYPNKPIRIVVPFAAGGTSDILARAIGPHLTAAWSQPVIVENRTGANGNVGADFVAKSAPDGYTLLLSDVGALAINPSVYANMPFDPAKDFSPVVMVSYSPHVLAVHPSVPVSNVRELIALRQGEPGQAQLRQLGHRRRAAPRRRRVRRAHRRAVDLHPLQGRLGGGHRRDRGQRQRAVQRHARHLSVGERRPAAKAWPCRARSACLPRPNCPRWPRRCRDSRPAPTRACSRPPARRARS